jgi:hypothetical protein
MQSMASDAIHSASRPTVTFVPDIHRPKIAAERSPRLNPAGGIPISAWKPTFQ